MQALEEVVPVSGSLVVSSPRGFESQLESIFLFKELDDDKDDASGNHTDFGTVAGQARSGGDAGTFQVMV